MKFEFYENESNKMNNFLRSIGISEQFFENEIMINDKYLISARYGEKSGDLTQELRYYNGIYIAISGKFNCTYCWYYLLTRSKRTATKWLTERKKY